MADDDGHIAPASGIMYEDDPNPGDYDGGDWGDDIDDDDDEDWDGDWGHGFPEFPPPPHGRGNPYANVYGQSDRNHHSPEPFPRPGRQRDPYTSGSSHGDRYQHIPEPRPRRGGPRNPFTNNFDPRGSYQANPEPFPQRGGPRSPFTNNFDPRGRYQHTPEPIPRRNDRRTSYANDYDRDYQYEDFSPRGANNNRRRHTFGPEEGIRGRFQQIWGTAPSSPHSRNHGQVTTNEVLEEIARRGGRPPPGMSPWRFRDHPPPELVMGSSFNAPRPLHDGSTAIQRSVMSRDAIRGRTQRRSRSGRFWRVVRSFFGHTS